ncbi:nucleotide exchange factor GrpE [Bordetella trematum]|uniref:Protein GrpE n=1 Tax=Bordetella trematum TaxID=123899 RepID=A0A157PWB3_9BORD|nr:nucleotide exchange factor GrpE [Bordetella trematum]AUL48140.1 nucleotide exchange factor GrpE [Bordetella trematum]AZR95061.1 nucleotide exchange factor GrpE [Bordetella trematum]NNH18603.1 nucleotide exchange factor GrpE [Bordetella trematum]QIM70050.1 nucleotide exchange factor GrpE [Bordetella trematum]SAI37811.1 heat shock protein GrpE [Bordetella trematum]
MTASQEPVDPVQDPDIASTADELQAELAAVRAELEAAQAQVLAQQEQALRAMAEAENVRRRSQEDVSKARKFGIESFAESLVPVKDSLEAALAQGEQTVEAFREGVEVTLKQLTGAFERNQLKEVAPAAGDKFDPHLHQAISSIPSEQPANTVVQLLQKGYVIADRTLRPALVVVSAGQG